MRLIARLHAYPPAHNAGAEWMVHSMLRALVARGHTCEAWLSRYSPERETYDLDGVTVVPLRARQAVSSQRPDVLLSHLENTRPTGALARGFGLPYIAVAHNTFAQTGRELADTRPDLVVYNSQWMRAELGDDPNGIVVRPPVFSEDYATEPGDAVTLVNLAPGKGGVLFWELARALPHVPFLGVIGCYGEQIIPADAADLRNVQVLDHTPGHRMREDVYARTRVLLMPSNYESWGRVGVEAMASGIPVIAHPTEGLTESLGDAGIFLDRDDTAAWVNAIEALAKPKAWQKASQAAAKRSAELDPTADLEAWCDAVENLLGR